MDDINEISFQMHTIYKNPIPLIHSDVFRTPNSSDKKNWHNNIELLYFTSDNITVCYDEVNYEVNNGDIFIISPNKSHQVFAGNSTITYHFFIIDNEFCKSNDIDVDSMIYEKIIKSDSAEILIKQLIHELESDSILKNARIKSSLLQLMLYLSLNHATPSSDPNKAFPHISDGVKYAINYINSHLFDKLTLEYVAKKVGISKYYFSREFKKQTGVSFVSYINKLRCKKAADLILADNHSLNQIALMCGFDTLSYFSTTFKKHVGIAPSDYGKSQNIFE